MSPATTAATGATAAGAATSVTSSAAAAVRTVRRSPAFRRSAFLQIGRQNLRRDRGVRDLVTQIVLDLRQ